MRRWAMALIERMVRRVGPLTTRHLSVSSALESYPRTPTAPRLILVCGSDRRDDASASEAGPLHMVTGASADVIIVLALDTVAMRLEILWVPRDLGVEIDGLGRQLVGSTLEYGGAALLVRRVSDIVGLALHHYVEIDFAGFGAALDAVGGLDVEVPYRIRDPRTGLDLEAGLRHLDGATALAFIRSRYNESDDDPEVVLSLGPAVRSQRLMALVEGIRRRVSSGIGPATLWRMASAVRQHWLADRGFDGGVAFDLLEILRYGEVDFGVVPTHRNVPPTDLRSPFPPHPRSGFSLLEVHPLPRRPAKAAPPDQSL
jgi:LCP family protein required for cell wall assembly